MKSGSVTDWLRSFEQGDEDAARRLWERYSGEMRKVAQRRLRRLKRRDIVDDEDVVVSAFASFCLALRDGKLAGIANRDELWALLVVITNRQVGQRAQYAHAAKRDVRQQLSQAELHESVGSRFERMADAVADPADQVRLADSAEHLLAKLHDADLQAIAVLKAAGHTIDEIAAEMGFARRTVQRMLSVIRSCWEESY